MNCCIRSIVALCLALLPGLTIAQAPAPVVQAIARPRNPLPPENDSVGVTKFSFLVYGDTRGRRDGIELQHEHSLVVDGMLAAIKRLETTAYPVRFILQSGDAVVNGTDPRQWNVSFVRLINRLTMEGGVPYYLAPGNHDLTSSQDLDSPMRLKGLRNYLQAMANLIPPDTASRRLPEYPTYAFGYGNTFVIALDSNIANDQTQYDWVRKQLEGLDRKRYVNIVVLLHHPIFSSGPHGGARIEPPTAALRARYMPLFQAHHVKVVFSGHDHLFDHWVEHYTDGNARYRMDLVTSGGGGAPLYAYSGEPDLRDYLKTNEAAKVQLEHLAKPGLTPGDNPYHFLIIRVDGEHMNLEAVGVDFGRAWQPYRSNRTSLEDTASVR